MNDTQRPSVTDAMVEAVLASYVPGGHPSFRRALGELASAYARAALEAAFALLPPAGAAEPAGEVPGGELRAPAGTHIRDNRVCCDLCGQPSPPPPSSPSPREPADEYWLERAIAEGTFPREPAAPGDAESEPDIPDYILPDRHPYGYDAEAVEAAHKEILANLRRQDEQEVPGPAYGIIDPDYARVFTIARCIAWSEGYALLMHGSFSRDLDLLAAPWTEQATDAEHLVKRIELALDDLRLLVKTTSISSQATEKPHGRRSWTLTFKKFGDPRFVDLAVMPRTTLTASAAPAPAAREQSDAVLDKAANAIIGEMNRHDHEGMLREGGAAILDMAKDYARAALAARPERDGWRPPVGWKLVPETPTTAMRAALAVHIVGGSWDFAGEAWRIALAKAPPAPASDPGEPGTGREGDE